MINNKWFNIDWWKYILEKPKHPNYRDVGRITIIICRIKNHPCGVIWYNPSGFEPDMHCRNCGEDLG